MKIGLFTATYLDESLEDVCRKAADYGYEAVEIPAFKDGNTHIDLDTMNAAEIKKMVSGYGLSISALSNHTESLLVLGPYGKDTEWIHPGTKEERIAFGTERMIKTAEAANALEVPVVCGFMGCENFGRFFPFPYSSGWAEMEQEFADRWGKILDKFSEYGVKFAHEPHPNQLVYDIDTALRAVELVNGHEAWGYNFDPANLIYLGIDVENFIDKLAGRIFHVHAKDGEVVSHNVKNSGVIPRETGRGSAAASGSGFPDGVPFRGRKL